MQAYQLVFKAKSDEHAVAIADAVARLTKNHQVDLYELEGNFIATSCIIPPSTK